MRHGEHCLMKMQMQRHEVTSHCAEDFSSISFPLLDSALTRLLGDLRRRDRKRSRSSWVRLLSPVLSVQDPGKEFTLRGGPRDDDRFDCLMLISPFELGAVRKNPLDTFTKRCCYLKTVNALENL